ncbi:MAG: TetR/AcrR family transcriptional regulator, repressor of the mexAB-oprM multidrug resistance operon [Chloroflexota bacterium]|jgi:AcrR family transcriptional regulator|nr:TetR/AcrR family transcriptional regulator, repressor of the mexAB-oprM multidrug resistance operon [Chloroflexota bacterium]
MPPNRSQRARDAKVVEILDLAEKQLLAGGFNGMSVAGIARELGIAANTVYWYFPSKDHLLVAVVERLMQRTLQAKPPHSAGLARQAIYFVDRLSEDRRARIALQERAAHSTVAADLDATVRAGMRAMLTGGLKERLPAAAATDAADAFLATVEGALALDMPKKERDRVLTLVLERLAGTA